MPIRTSLLACLLLAAGAARAQAPSPDLSTPERALRVFVDAGRAGDWARAAAVLDLRHLPEARRGADGAALARKLKHVLDSQLWIDWSEVSDLPEGSAADGAGADVVGTVALGKRAVPIRLVRGADGAWRIGPGTVEAIEPLYEAHGPGWLGERVPAFLAGLRWLEVEAWQWLGLLATALLALLLAAALGYVLRRVVLRLARRTRATWDDLLVEAATGPVRFLLGVALFAVAVRALHLAVPAARAVDELLRVLSMVGFTWAGLRTVGFVAGVIEARVTSDVDPLAARGVKTQVMVLRRVAWVVVLVVGGALVLLQFQGMRSLGTSLLASAGVGGLVVGLAAQRSLSSLLAGIQLSVTQPVRVGDVVIVENEWGVVEEITLTYVVVKIWDLRRLVVPITRFLEAPFQNWTRTGADLLGTVFLRADYRVPVAEVRDELARYVKTRAKWDGKVVGLQVTDADARTVELRGLVSAANAGDAWDLRCEVREHLIAWLQAKDGGRYLPRTRVEAGEGEGGDPDRAAPLGAVDPA